MTAWFVAATLPNAETVAIENLKKQGYETFLPKILERCAGKRGSAMIPRLMFPGYVFVGFDPVADRWGPINNTRGVFKLLATTAGLPSQVPAPVMDVLLGAVGANGVAPMRATDTWPSDVGQTLAIGPDHPFAGFTGICTYADEQRVQMLLEVMSAQRVVTIQRRHLHVDHQRTGSAKIRRA